MIGIPLLVAGSASRLEAPATSLRPHRIGAMLEVGEKAPLEAVVWTTPRESPTVGELVGGDPLLLLFYLFDWSAT